MLRSRRGCGGMGANRNSWGDNELIGDSVALVLVPFHRVASRLTFTLNLKAGQMSGRLNTE